ncbi:hypothetical protein ACIRS1_21175 [Kitasatospora sp. NPDC101176]|uniref:hypothetical protein n=1 Tax=Kitasatospora sp. NPDC101176 TaxID=3364099 RepID=UPI00382789FA
MPIHRVLSESVTATLRGAGFPIADSAGGTEGMMVVNHAHGVTVSWRDGARSAAVEPPASAGSRPHSGADVRSRPFQLTLRVAALLADVGYCSEHLGNRVLVSERDGR